MKKITISILSIIFLANIAFAQKFTEDEFMKKYYEKTGMDKHKDIKTLIIEGETQVMDDHYPFILYYRAPGHYRMVERYKSDKSIKIISDTYNQINGKDGQSKEMSNLEHDLVVNIMNFNEGFLANYKRNGFKIEYLGLDTLNKTTAFNKPSKFSLMPSPPDVRMSDGSLDLSKMNIDTLLTAIVHKIKVTTPQDKEYTLKVDTTSMNVLWSSGNPFIFADIGGIKFNLYQFFGGISFPVHMNVQSNYIPITYRVNNIKINEEIPNSYFDPKDEINQIDEDD
ncbi:MAG: hypothetical protein A2X64_05070 [Ignavibacteria bacterium GWF2_33_9]|nr:MAG: hypothetical protein A2X64_05070 [Ignavibacteria bacterium GWF2_33_9]